MLRTVHELPCPVSSRARFDLIASDQCSGVCFEAHLVRKPFHVFRDALPLTSSLKLSSYIDNYTIPE
ncbi:hypothetical protein FG152_24210 [Ochrobactrum sp. XJ1]|nr:hypothetical protein [Ochrobactrum sp. XJ1]